MAIKSFGDMLVSNMLMGKQSGIERPANYYGYAYLEITSSQTVTLPDVPWIEVFTVGGGGGGGNAGGGGGYTRSAMIALDNILPKQLTAIIGAGGTVTASNGSSGGSTYIAEHKTHTCALGGRGASGSGGGTGYGYGGDGGSGGAAFNYNGGDLKRGPGGIDGNDGYSANPYTGGIGQGYTTRAFGDPAAPIDYAQGGCTNSAGRLPKVEGDGGWGMNSAEQNGKPGIIILRWPK